MKMFSRLRHYKSINFPDRVIWTLKWLSGDSIFKFFTLRNQILFIFESPDEEWSWNYYRSGKFIESSITIGNELRDVVLFNKSIISQKSDAELNNFLNKVLNRSSNSTWRILIKKHRRKHRNSLYI